MRARFWKRRRALVAIVAAVSAFVAAWVVVAVVVPLVQEAPCAGIEFHTPAQAEAPSTVHAGRPPIGGQGGVAGKVRSALRGPGDAVYCRDFADPFVLRVGNAYYAYSTNTANMHLPVLTSSGLFGTGHRSDALPKLPRWSSPGRVWAPAVLPRPEGFVLYYTTRASHPDRQCLSRAVGARPGGPFIGNSSGPLACPSGGAIDASPFVDADGRAYLLWKQDDGTGRIVSQELSPDGLNLVGPMGSLLVADQAWEAGVVEAPSMVTYGGRYYLFYSGNDWDTANYAIGYAVCDSPLGPCTKPTDAPWLTSTARAQGPGGQEVFSDETGQLWLALHAWVGGNVGYPRGARNLFVVRLGFANGAPVTT